MKERSRADYAASDEEGLEQENLPNPRDMSKEEKMAHKAARRREIAEGTSTMMSHTLNMP